MSAVVTAAAAPMTGREIVEAYRASGYRVVCWPAIGDSKGPRDPGWPSKVYTLEDYSEGFTRVGLMTGVEVAPGKFLHDYDQDWAPGAQIAAMLLPTTNFVYGRASKPRSHWMHTLEIALPSFRFEDVDNTVLSEIRGVKSDGATVGLQSMVPPSVWSPKGVANPTNDQLEPLTFVHAGDPAHVPAAYYKKWVTYTNIAQILAKHLGVNGFGHDVRLMFAGFLLRMNIDTEDVIKIGEAMSGYCNNLEVHDVRTAVASTESALQDPKKKVKGGPALAKHLGSNGRKIIDRIREWLGKEEDFLRDDHGRIVPNSQHNIKRALAVLGVELTYDSFAERELIEREGVSSFFDDDQLNNLWLDVDQECGFRPSLDFFGIVTRHLARANAFHPVLDYFNGLTWDGVPRLNTWLRDCGGAEDTQLKHEGDGPTYLEMVSAIFFIAPVKRVYDPGCKHDEMVVLETPEQGTNKSSAVQATCPDPEWVSDDLPLNASSKEILEKTRGKLIIESSDLAGRSKAEVEGLKAMLSRRVDSARMAYARKTSERQRQFVFVGTTNSSEYLNDPTGGRRFWPVRIKKFNVEAIVKVRDQLWAEAVARYRRGESNRMPERLWAVAGEQQEARRSVDNWEGVLQTSLESIRPSSDGKRRVTTDNLFAALGMGEVFRRDLPSQKRVSQIMARLGFTRDKVYDSPSKRSVNGYIENVASGLNVGADDACDVVNRIILPHRREGECEGEG